MPRTARAAAIGLLAWLLVWQPGGTASPMHHAGLVVRHGNGELIYAYIAFPEQSITGVQLLQQSGISVVTVPFGGLGDAVCEIDDEGCPVSTCRKRLCQGSGADAPFWQFFSQVKPGDWQPLALGASSTTVHDGDVFGWSWTGDAAQLPPLTLAVVAKNAGVSAALVAVSGNAVPTPAVRHVLPPGITAQEGRGKQRPLEYVAAAVFIAMIAGGGFFISIRRRGASR